MNETIKKIDAYLEQFVGSTMEQIIMQEAKREIEKLIKDRDEADTECREANASWCREIEESIDLNRELTTRTAERDEARRLLKSVVDLVRESMLSTQSVPNHICGYAIRPDIGVCKVCEDFTDALAMIYPNEFEEEAR